jgi:hypothetical protein
VTESATAVMKFLVKYYEFFSVKFSVRGSLTQAHVYAFSQAFKLFARPNAHKAHTHMHKSIFNLFRLALFICSCRPLILTLLYQCSLCTSFVCHKTSLHWILRASFSIRPFVRLYFFSFRSLECDSLKKKALSLISACCTIHYFISQ